jgi:hypothetical protein
MLEKPFFLKILCLKLIFETGKYVFDWSEEPNSWKESFIANI